jgi:hypothetical protein
MMHELFWSSVPACQNEYVNVVGMLGWFLYGRILRYKSAAAALQPLQPRASLLKIERPFASIAVFH